jgi:hypothetical protein
MLTFRNFLVEKIVGNTGWVYHRTKNNPEESDIITQGIRPSTNQSAMYGRGLYCCYDFDQQLKSQMEMYGDYIIKGKVDLNNFAILDENVYRLANPRGDFEKHLKDIGTNMNSVKHNIPYTSRTARIIWKKCKEKAYNGIVFTGETDGKVVVIWNRRNFIPFQYTMDDGINWIKLTPNIKSIKRPHDREYDKDDEKISYSKILRELSNKEVIGDVYPPVDYYDNIILKNVIKCATISSRNSRGIDAPNLIESDDIIFIEAEKVNLPKLEKSKVIEFHNLLEKLSLPELKLADDIISRKVYEIDFPKLRNLNDGITAHRCEYVNIPELTYCGHGGLFLPESHKINLQKLRVCGGTITISPLEVDLQELIECENFTAPKSVTINLPKLRQAFGSLEFTRANEINLPELKYCELLDAHYARKVNLINLEELTTTVIEGIGIHMNYIEELYLPKLKICRFFNTPNLKKLTISKSFKNLEKIKEYLPRDCEIIFSEDTPQIKVDENVTFKKYLMLKESLVQIPLDSAYDIFKNEYDKSTGASWTYDKFMGRARNWEFYGDEKGYVAIRRQRSGLVKLVGMAGDNRSKLKGINDLISMKMPLWGMVSKDIKDIAVRKGMREPNFLERQVLKRSIPPEVLGGAEILEYQKDGGIKLQYPDVGVVVKYLVGTPEYYAKLRTMLGDKVKEKILG